MRRAYVRRFRDARPVGVMCVGAAAPAQVIKSKLWLPRRPFPALDQLDGAVVHRPQRATAKRTTLSRVITATLGGRAVELPRVLTMRAAAELGISRATVRNAIARHGWQVLARGVVLTVPGPPTRHDWALVALELAGPAAALSGWDAVCTYGLGDSTPPALPVLVLDRAGHNRTIGGAHIRPTERPYAARMLPAEHPTLPFAAVVRPARAVADAALGCTTLRTTRALVTSSVQRKKCRPEELVAELAACPRNGSGFLRRALDDVLDGARSVAEAEAVDFLRRGRVPSFELNVPLVDRWGRTVAYADIFWRALRAIGEIDSLRWHLLEVEGWENTGVRHNRLTGHRLALQHWPPSQIRTSRMQWAAQVEAWLRDRADEIGVHYAVGSGPVRPPAGQDPPPYLLT